ncbi:MAG: ATP-binding protein, partial [Nanoarchaeota archaeon]
KYHIFILNDIVLKNSLIKFLNEISGKQQKIIIIEDIDRHPEYMISSLLNTLDGISKNENMLVIATCNNIANIDTALINRPSRFDRIYYLGDPNEDQRERLLKYYFPKIKLEELNECIELSKGFSCAYFKELFLTSKINNLTPVEALKYFKEQLKLISERYTKDAFRK